jgi:hypothetical protein
MAIFTIFSLNRLITLPAAALVSGIFLALERLPSTGEPRMWICAMLAPDAMAFSDPRVLVYEVAKLLNVSRLGNN